MPSKPWLSHYDPGVPAQLDYPAVPVFHFLDEAARLCPERACLIFQGKTSTYREVAFQTDRLAGALLDLGIRKGDRVGICMPNCPEFVLAYFAILKAGAVVVAINPLYTPPEIVQQVNDAGLETIFCAGNLYERIKTAQPGTGIQRVIVTGDTYSTIRRSGIHQFIIRHSRPNRKAHTRKEFSLRYLTYIRYIWYF